MIKANELRLGNLITYGAHGLVIVNEIKASGKIRVTHTEQSSIDLGYIDSLLREVNLDPIPLTVECLKKLGFEDIYDNGYDCALRLDRFTFAVSIERRLLIIADPKATNQRAKGIGEIPIEHVHQLQNLVFAMSGEELTIKQPI